VRAIHRERHRTERIGWLRAAVLGANDGIVSTASLLVGVASAGASHSAVVTTGVAGMVAGALSMAAGEYVSVGSQADSEAADLAKERAELSAQPELERQELASIYVKRGLTPALAAEVADQLMKKDALQAHARDELGITPEQHPRPALAAASSAVSFAFGAAVPLVFAAVAPASLTLVALAAGALVALVVLGAVGARAGGAPILRPALRVGVLGALAMAVTAAVGHLFGAVAG
jgi:VIT1/CCC1 family predicted Fe2+/Mn2+ transporter